MLNIESLLNSSAAYKDSKTSNVQRHQNFYPGAPVVSDPFHSSVVNVVDLDFKQGPWIAGGAALLWCQGKEVGRSDIDLFFRNRDQFEKTRTELQKLNHTVRFESDNAITLAIYKDQDQELDRFRAPDIDVVIVQLIKKKFFNCVEEIFEHFDITVCQVATDGFSFYMGQNAADDIYSKTLRFERFRKDSLKRLLKYIAYGYKPLPDQIANVLKNAPLDNPNFWQVNGEEYGNAF